MFSNKDLKNMIVPLFFEQLLVMLVGIMGTFIVSYAGEAAVSGVSLVNSFNTIFIEPSNICVGNNNRKVI